MSPRSLNSRLHLNVFGGFIATVLVLIIGNILLCMLVEIFMLLCNILQLFMEYCADLLQYFGAILDTREATSKVSVDPSGASWTNVVVDAFWMMVIIYHFLNVLQCKINILGFKSNRIVIRKNYERVWEFRENLQIKGDSKLYQW